MRKAWTGVAALAAVLLLSACNDTTGKAAAGAGASASSSPSVSASPSPSAPAVTVLPADGASAVRPDQKVSVSVANGTLQNVALVGSGEAAVNGTIEAGAWHSLQPLALDTKYTLTVTSQSADGTSHTNTSSFTTLEPKGRVSAVLTPGDDWNVGVGMPVQVVFSRNVTHKDDAVKALSVRSDPPVVGAWHWMAPDQVWWRPQTYWPSGAKVKVTAALGGLELADGLWGRRTVTSQFTVGTANVSTVDTQRHTLTVRQNGQVVRTIPVTTGKAGFTTRNGVKVIMDRAAKVKMDAATTGTDPKDPEYYNLDVKWAMRLTWSGEYLHAAPWSVGSQGRANVSHGCTGMSNANAEWMYHFSKVGDVVEFTGSPRALEWGNGWTVWEMPWSTWSKDYGPSGGAAVSPTGSASADPSASATASASSAATSGASTGAAGSSPSAARSA